MINDEKLFELNSLGFIPGPDEDEETFLKRVKLSQELNANYEKFLPDIPCEKIKKPFLSWVKAQLLNLYDFVPDSFFGFFSNENLTFFQGAAVWEIEKEGIKLPILQIRKQMAKGSYLFIYKIEEILAHEAVHAARVAFCEPIFEEILAYLTSSSSFRKNFGPILRYHWEGWTFLSVLLFSFLFNWIFILFDRPLFAFLSSCGMFLGLFMFLFGLLRLIRAKIIFKKTHQRLGEITKKPLAVMLRLTDEEIRKFSKMSSTAIYKYIMENSDKYLRLKMIYAIYFLK
jgi:hypothetical protein